MEAGSSIRSIQMFTIYWQKKIRCLKKLTQASVYRQTDYLTFLVTLQQQKIAVLQAKVQLQYDYAQLNYITGLFDTTLQSLSVPEIALTV